MGGREVPFEAEAVCEVCGAKGAFDFMGHELCDGCAYGPEEERRRAEESERVSELLFQKEQLKEEIERLGRVLKRRENKIKHLKQQLSENKLRRRIDTLTGTIGQQARVIQHLKREKEALHAHWEHRQDRQTGGQEGETQGKEEGA